MYNMPNYTYFQSPQSNETSQTYYLERTQSARITLEKAMKIFPPNVNSSNANSTAASSSSSAANNVALNNNETNLNEVKNHAFKFRLKRVYLNVNFLIVNN